MYSPRTDLIKSIGAQLQTITYEGGDVPFYGRTPEQAPEGLYIALDTVSTNETGCKDNFGHEATITLSIVDNRAVNYASNKAVEEVAQLIMQAIKPTVTSVVPMTYFAMIYMVLENAFDDIQLFETSYAPRVLMQWRCELTERADLCENWILADGTWNDDGIWVDGCTWNDGV